MENRLWGWEVGGTSSQSYPVVGFGISTISYLVYFHPEILL
jgi:hypothetical protein